MTRALVTGLKTALRLASLPVVGTVVGIGVLDEIHAARAPERAGLLRPEVRGRDVLAWIMLDALSASNEEENTYGGPIDQKPMP
jgi:hypothetical protein